MLPIATRIRASFQRKLLRNAHRRRGASTVVVLVAIAAIAIAGVVAYQSSSTGDAQALAEAARPITENRAKPKHVEPPPDSGEFRTRLAVLRIGSGDAAKSVVALAKPKGPQNLQEINGSDQSLLGRELIRQALLIAARDEMGLATRDEILDDEPPAEGETAGLELASVLRADGGKAVIRRSDAEGKVSETLLSRDLARFTNDLGLLLEIVPDAEALSRSEFPKALNGLGLKGGPNKVRTDAPLSGAVEDRLTRLNFIETFAAIRDLHAAIRGDGESSTRLGALARGYAQLGVLTEFHWHPAHKAFKARALLYAQRLVAREPKSPDALRNRAFVRALIGLPKAALDDLTAAAKGAETAKTAGAAPAWIPVIESYAKHDLKSLKSIDGPYAPLAALLRLFAVRYPLGTHQMLQAARDVLKAAPDCYRAYDMMCEAGGIGTFHFVTTAAPGQFLQSLTVNMKEVADLPTRVQAPVERLNTTLQAIWAKQGNAPHDENAEEEVVSNGPNPLTDELAIVDALAEADKAGENAGEPNWGTLAHLLRETNFVNVWRRLYLMAKMWSVPVEGYWAAVRPLVEHHRYRPFLDLYGRPGPEGRSIFAEFVKHIDSADLEMSESQLIRDVKKRTETNDAALWWVVYCHDDAIVSDLSEGARNEKKAFAITKAKTLLEIDPRSGFAMSILIKQDWDNVKGKVTEWREATHDSHALLAELAKKYSELKQYGEARQVLAAYIRQSPDVWAYELLASNHKAQGDLDRWRGTLREYLEATYEEKGLEHARIQVQLADDLMAQKKWAEAKPYAEAAAETWSGWGMVCAGRCAEGMEDWQTAETWFQRTTERYPSYSWAEWFCFCKRSGHGDLASAQKGAEAYLAENADRPDLANLNTAGFFYWTTKDLKKAAAAFSRDFETNHTLLSAFNVALIDDELGDAVGRDAAIAAGCKLPQEQGPKSLRILGLLGEDLASGGKGPDKLAEIDQVLESIPVENRATTEFYVGQYLRNRGKSDLASKYFQRCVDSPTASVWVRLISADIMRSLGDKAK